MARYSEHNTKQIYEAAQTFRDNCLLRDGSLVFDNSALWKTDLLERIHKVQKRRRSTTLWPQAHRHGYRQGSRRIS